MEKDALLKAIIWDIETNDKGVVRSITAKFDRHTKGTGQGHLFPPDISADDKTRAEELSREFQRFLRTIGFSDDDYAICNNDKHMPEIVITNEHFRKLQTDKEIIESIKKATGKDLNSYSAEETRRRKGSPAQRDLGYK